MDLIHLYTRCIYSRCFLQACDLKKVGKALRCTVYQVPSNGSNNTIMSRQSQKNLLVEFDDSFPNQSPSFD